MSDIRSPWIGVLWILLSAALAAGLAFGTGPLARHTPWSWEKNAAYILGSTTSLNVCHGSPENQKLLNRLVTRLYPLDSDDKRFSINVQVVNNSQINAFAELGGKISLNKGLLEKAHSPEEVAGVLAHEITHVKRRHILEGFMVRMLTVQGLEWLFGGSSSSAQWTSFFLNMSFTRTQEAEADRGALRRLHKAHVAKTGFGAFFLRLRNMDEPPEFLSDHPSSDDRYNMVQSYPHYESKPLITHEEWESFKDYCQ